MSSILNYWDDLTRQAKANDEAMAIADAQAEAFYEGSQWTAVGLSSFKASQERLNERQKRIYAMLHENRSKLAPSIECEYGYCEAFVDGEIAIEQKVKEMRVDFTRAEAIQNKCHGIAYPEAFIQALEAMGLIKFKEPDMPPVMKALCAIMTETEVRQGPDYGKLTTGQISQYGAGCIIDVLRAKGFEIVKSNGEG